MMNRKSWCPDCPAGLGERLTKVILQELFEEKFIKCKPAWLKNNRGKRMELDGYCEVLNLAFEYQGAQHQKVIPKYKGTKQKLAQRIIDDKDKLAQCQKQGITLIQVPDYSNQGFNPSQIKAFLIEQCLKLGVPLTQKQQTKEIDVSDAYRAADEKLRELQAICNEKGGQCLSEHYKLSTTMMWFECSKGHKWQASPNKIKNDRWCKECGYKSTGNKLRSPIADIQRFIEAKGGTLLTEVFDNSTKHLLVQCKKKHQPWQILRSNLFKGHWCPKCRSITKKEVEAILQQHSFKLINCESMESNSILTGKTRVWVTCEQGHKWNPEVRKIKEGTTGCKDCNKKRYRALYSHSVDHIRREGSRRGLDLLSKLYSRNDIALEWQCMKSCHPYRGSFRQVLNLTGCIECRNETRRH
ncbi:hypothetical protein LRP52_31940 [Photobacterium sp. ZSDE20]|uniref:Zinc-ribbon domain-containing protein n=1 Tax=Photobacterium pectinilyticum TaxID=2906793 RepID=A0ABT1N5G9_9GAMM|nr:hypothetical protein [Photobacterium sp. ZSDE20]MCQ1059976.1 hypothetical protein [Photobacterium sp. ZSDE20]MDD1826800.1 hypothetical protein [Photobacterium sp. ZSDE20]